jgi:Na+/melibiose symporter-like transporter
VKFSSLFLLNPFLLVAYATLLAVIIRTIHKRVQERSDLSTGRFLIASAATFLSVAFIAVGLAVLAMFLVTWLVKTFNVYQSGFGFPVFMLLFGLPLCLVLGSLCAIPLGSRVSRLFWPTEPNSGEGN